jgi:hypothetical protein
MQAKTKCRSVSGHNGKDRSTEQVKCVWPMRIAHQAPGVATSVVCGDHPGDFSRPTALPLFGLAHLREVLPVQPLRATRTVPAVAVGQFVAPADTAAGAEHGR